MVIMVIRRISGLCIRLFLFCLFKYKHRIPYSITSICVICVVYILLRKRIFKSDGKSNKQVKFIKIHILRLHISLQFSICYTFIFMLFFVCMLWRWFGIYMPNIIKIKFEYFLSTETVYLRLIHHVTAFRIFD